MTLFPIRNEQDHDRALARIDELMSAEAGTAEGYELDALVTLVDRYEEQHFPMSTPPPAAFIKFMMEQKGLTRKDLEPMIGSRARVSEVLSGKRNLTLNMIRKLHKGLDISAEYLIAAPAEAATPLIQRPKVQIRKKPAKAKLAARARTHAIR